MLQDIPGIAALVGSVAALFGAAAFAVRSRVKLEELRENQRASAEVASEAARQRAEVELRLDRDRWRERAERAEAHENALSADNADLREAIALGHPRQPRRTP